jgi:HPt (histidine-containing phosphotransfer) domain-containing protein
MAAKLRSVLFDEARKVRMPAMGGWSPNALPRIVAEGAHAMKDDRELCLTEKQLWNRSAALEILGGDDSLLNEMVQLFLVESPKLVVQMQQALAHNDARLLEMAAHCLKGELRYLVVPEASEAADKLETAGRTGEMGAAADLLGDLRARLELLWTLVSEDAGI